MRPLSDVKKHYDLFAEPGHSLSADGSRVNTTTVVKVWSPLSQGCVQVGHMDTAAHLEAVAACAFQLARTKGGSIPCGVVQALTDNFIHAKFRSTLVAISPDGCGIGLFDKGPGLAGGIDPFAPCGSTADELARNYVEGAGCGFRAVGAWARGKGCSFWFDGERKQGFAAFVACSDAGRAACSAMHAASAVIDELGFSEKHFAILMDEVRVAGPIASILVDDLGFSKERAQWAVLGYKDDPEHLARWHLEKSSVDVCLEAMESEMETSESYREAVMAARARVARGLVS